MEELIAHRRESDGVSQILSDHLLGVSKHAGNFAEKIGLRKSGELLGLLHDIGKASHEFQQYIKSATGLINPDADGFIDPESLRGKIDHSSSGAQFIREHIGTVLPKNKIASQILSLCVASHHSGLIDCISPDGVDKYSNRIEKDEEFTHAIESFSNLPNPLKNKLMSKSNDLNVVEELVIKCQELKDDLDSNDTFLFKIGLLIRFLLSCLLDADRLDTADFELPHNQNIRNYGNYPSWQKLIERLNEKISQFENKKDKNNIDILRNQISEECLAAAYESQGVFQLTVPTGGGKTISSLRFALNHADHHKLDRIFYIIPYTSIIDQNADEVRKILEDKDNQGNYLNQVVLEHHSNITPDEESYKQKLLSENWDAPIVFTTQVQFLESLFGAGTKKARRMHQLANSVIIFDEIQTLPIRCVHMFNVALRFLVKNCRTSIVLCTATQPLLHKVEPKSKSISLEPRKKIISNEHELYEAFKRVSVVDNRKAGGWSLDEISDLTLKELKKTGSVLIVVNTKKSARDLFFALKRKECPGLYHLSTSMCPTHRLDILSEIRSNLAVGTEPVVCVSTQLIEAGVDVDFGSVIRYLAGLDSITQAAGRCNRNNRRPKGYVHIINPNEENISRLKDIVSGLKNCERILEEYKKSPALFSEEMIGIKALEQYYKYYFYSRKEEMSYNVGEKTIVGRNDNIFSLLSNNVLSITEYNRINLKNPIIPFWQAFNTANKAFHTIDTNTRGIIVPYKKGGELISQLISFNTVERQFSLLKQAQKFSVNLRYPGELNKLIDLGAIHETQKGSGIYYLQKNFYSDFTGWLEEGEPFTEDLIL